MSRAPGFGLDPRAELEEEIRHHILEGADALVEEGWDRGSALREAERRFGSVDSIRREMMSVRRGGRSGAAGWMRSLGGDVRYALRGLRGRPGFALAVVATLALGIGAASSIFAVVDALLLRPMPYEEAERLVEVNGARPDGSYYSGLNLVPAREWRDAAPAFADGWLAYQRVTLVRTDGPMAEPLSVVAVTPGADTLLGLPLLMGRAFMPDDARPGSPDVAVLARGYYERLGGDPSVLGRTLRLEGGLFTVVGVLRGGVRFPDYAGDPDVWIPLRDDFSMADRTGRCCQGVWARLHPGLDAEAAQERADAIASALQEQNPQEAGWRVHFVPVGAHRANPGVKRALWVLSATVGVIFLIALVNGVNLLLVRTSTRTRELAVRLAIGGSRARLLRQILVEGLVLGLAGAAAAVGLAWMAVVAMRGLLPSEVIFFSPHAFEVEGRTLAFAFGAALLAGTMLGLVPALQVLRDRGLAPSLGGRAAEDTLVRRRLRNGLVVAQVALSMVLLFGAALFVRSFARLVSVDPGFDHERIALVDMSLSPTRYADAADRAAFARRLEEALETHPGVEGATVTGGGGFYFGAALQAEGEAPPADQPSLIPHTAVSPDYFRVMGVELAEGRGFEPGDAESGAAIVDRDLARFLWAGASAVGRRFRMGEEGEWMTVVGVARELRLMGRDQREGPYQILYPMPPDRVGSYVEVAARTPGDPQALLPAMRDAVRSLDPEQPIWRLRTAEQALAEEEDRPRFLVTLMSLLAAVAVALAAVGLYGVLSFSVTRRAREMGIRMALGADRARLRRMVLTEGVGVALLGVLLGVGGAVAASRFVAQLLYEVEPRDPATLTGTAALLLAVAAAASTLPAFRATRVDPAEVLREE